MLLILSIGRSLFVIRCIFTENIISLPFYMKVSEISSVFSSLLLSIKNTDARNEEIWHGLILHGMVWFVFVEGLRTDLLMLGPLRVAQLVSLVFVAIGILGIFGLWDSLFKKLWPFRKEKPVVLFDLDGTLVDTNEADSCFFYSYL